MKTLLSIVLGILLFASCEDDTTSFESIDFSDGDTLSLKFGQKYINEAYSIEISMDSILEDSRCPPNANCVWLGVATVRFNYLDNQTNHQITLSTIEERQYKRDTVINQTKIYLINLLPYPELDVTPLKEDHEALLIISRYQQ